MPIWLAPIIGLIGTLVGGYLILRGQRATREFQAIRDDRQMLRDRAQDLFDEITEVKNAALPSAISMMIHYAEANTELRKPIMPMPTIAKMKSLIAVYFPELLPMIREHEDITRKLGEKASAEINLNDTQKIEGWIMANSYSNSQRIMSLMTDIESSLLVLTEKFSLQMEQPTSAAPFFGMFRSKRSERESSFAGPIGPTS